LGADVEQLARLIGETVDPDIASRIDITSRINELKQAEAGGAGAAGAGQEMGLREAIRWVFRQPLILPLTPTQVRDHMAEMGYDPKQVQACDAADSQYVKEDERGGRDQRGRGNWRYRASVCKREVIAEIARHRRDRKSPRSSRELTRIARIQKTILPQIFADERGSKAKAFTAKGAKERKGDQGQEKFARR
jgi:hypothetical protein